MVRELEEGVDASLHDEAPELAELMGKTRVQVQYEGATVDHEPVVHATYFLDDLDAPEPPWGETLPRIQFDGCQVEVLYSPGRRKYRILYTSSFCAPVQPGRGAP